MLPEADLEDILARTSGLWEEARKGCFFVTGGTGFFGQWMLESFAHINQRLALGAQMTVLTRDPAGIAARAPALAAEPCIRFVRGDILRLGRELVLRQLPQQHPGEFGWVIHAAMDSVGQVDPLATFDTIVAGTRAALDFAAGSGTRRLLFASSGAVYGPQPPEMTHMPESWLGGPDCTRTGSAYGEGKRAAEVLCGCYHARLPALETVIARCFAFVGPLLPLGAHFAIGNFIRDAMRGGPIRIGGDGTPYRSYLYTSELAVWLWTLLFRGKAGRAYNVGSEEDVTILKLASTVAECFPSQIDVQIAHHPQPGAAASRYVPATGLARRELGLDAVIPLKEAISRTIAWHSSRNP